MINDAELAISTGLIVIILHLWHMYMHNIVSTLQIGFNDGYTSYSLLSGTTASNSFDYSYYYLDAGYSCIY